MIPTGEGSQGGVREAAVSARSWPGVEVLLGALKDRPAFSRASSRLGVEHYRKVVHLTPDASVCRCRCVTGQVSSRAG
jgi:hypothetical protein